MNQNSPALWAAVHEDVVRLLERDHPAAVARAEKAQGLVQTLCLVAGLAAFAALIAGYLLKQLGDVPWVPVLPLIVPVLVLVAFCWVAFKTAPASSKRLGEIARVEYGIEGVSGLPHAARMPEAPALETLHPEMTLTRAVLAVR